MGHAAVLIRDIVCGLFTRAVISDVTVNGAEVADYCKVKCRSTRFRLRQINKL